MKKIFLIVQLLILTIIAATGQENQKANPLKDSIDAQRFIFVPRTVLPQSMNSRMVNGYYEMKITKDKITVYLPYIGRAYSANIGQPAGPLDFEMTDFSYTTSKGKKGSDEIVIKPNVNTTDVRDMRLSVYDNGSAYLSVNFNSRQPISFNGYTDTIKEKKEKK